MLTEAFSHSLYFWSLAWYADYPWATDFLSNLYAPGYAYPGIDNVNLTQMAVLNAEAVEATTNNNFTGVVTLSNQMNQLANQAVLYLWTFYPALAWTNSAIGVFTSNVQGFYYNPSLNGMYFATMYVT